MNKEQEYVDFLIKHYSQRGCIVKNTPYTPPTKLEVTPLQGGFSPTPVEEFMMALVLFSILGFIFMIGLTVFGVFFS